MTPEQERLVYELMDRAKIYDPDLCLQVLASCNWDIISAQNVLGPSGPDNNVSNGNQGGLSHRRNTSSTSGNSSSSSNSSSSNQINNNSRSTNSNNNNNNTIFAYITTPLRWIFQVTPTSLHPEEDAIKFYASFQSEYSRCSSIPQFITKKYQESVSTAYRSTKLLLVYLHSPMHEDTDSFCTDVLCTTQFTTYVNNNNTILWAGSVWDPEPYRLSIQLKATSFPFLALCLCKSDREVQVIDRFNGSMPLEVLLQRLQRNMVSANNEFNRIRQESTRRSDASRLREEQDREYHRAAEQDRLKRIKLQEEKIANEKAEEERKQAEELQKAINFSNELAKESSIAKARDSVQAEPADGKDVATIRFQLPKGAKVNRRFSKTDTVQVIHNFLLLYFHDQKMNIDNFSISNYEKVVFTADKMHLNMEEIGVYPRGMLYVHDLDA